MPLVATSVQMLDMQGLPVAFDVLNNPFGVEAHTENVVCHGCNGGIQTYYPSPVGTFNNNGIMSLSTYKILPGETVSVSISVNLKTLDNLIKFFRVLPKEIKWFPDAALVDNTVSASEIHTYTFSNTNSNNWATDYSKLWLID